MHPKIREGLDVLTGILVAGAAVAVVGGLVIGAGGLFYQSCLKKTTLKDVTVTKIEHTYGVDDGLNVWEYDQIRLDKYNRCLSIDDEMGPVKVGDKFESITYRNNFLLCGVVVDYERD